MFNIIKILLNNLNYLVGRWSIMFHSLKVQHILAKILNDELNYVFSLKCFTYCNHTQCVFQVLWSQRLIALRKNLFSRAHDFYILD